MKVVKKISVYLLIGFLFCSSVILSYEKANNCKAVSIGVEIGLGVVTLALVLYGCYYVSDSDTQEEIKESLTNYKDMTVENAKFCYESNKKLFNDFVTYVTAKGGGGSTAVYTATGQSYTVNEMKEQGFPSFDEWDSEMKKQGSLTSSGGFGSIWDKLCFGLDLLDFICVFFEDDEYSGSSGSADEQSYFHGDDDYIDRETGEVNIFYHTRAFFSEWSYSDHMWYRLYKNFYGDINGTVAEKYKEDFRFALYCSSYMGIPYVGEEEFVEYPIDYNSPMLLFNMGNSSISNMGLSYIENGSKTFTRLSDGELENVNYYQMYITFKVNNPDNAIMCGNMSDIMNATNYSDYVYLSANVPLFATSEEAVYYIETGDYSNALNLAPELQPTPTSVPIAEKDSAVAVYCNYFSGRSVTPSDVVNVNYTIGNDWDGTATNLTVILQNDDDGVTVTPALTDKPIPTLADDDGSNTTNNYIINITNILQPIQETVTNIYNFFVIDTEEIGQAFTIDSVPTASFEPLIIAFNKLSSAFGSDEYESEIAEGNISSSETAENGSGEIATSQHGILKTDYPVISMKCPKILEPYVNTYVDGEKAIIICDFKKYATYFVRFRAFITACLYIGMLFYIMREVRVTFIIS